MGRSLGIPLLLVTLVVGAWLFVQQSKSEGPTSTVAAQAETQAAAAAATTDFQAATPTLQAYFADHDTYAGLTLPPAYGVTLIVAAGGGSYCLEAAGEHENGPGGQPQPGPC